MDTGWIGMKCYVVQTVSNITTMPEISLPLPFMIFHHQQQQHQQQQHIINLFSHNHKKDNYTTKQTKITIQMNL